MATWTKLKDGTWGIRAEGKVAVGTSVEVRKKSGESETRTVARVIWTDGKISLCSVGASRSKRRGPYECPECGDRVQPGTRCWETGCLH
jgi:hypothetical protein